MHSSRMRTGRSLTVCCSLLPGRGGVCLVRGGGGGSPCQVQGEVCLVQGGGFSLPGPGGSPCQVWGVLPARSGGGGVCLVWGVSLPGPGGACPETPPPPVNRITHTCKNITLATTSLRPVKIYRNVLKNQF